MKNSTSTKERANPKVKELMLKFKNHDENATTKVIKLISKVVESVVQEMGNVFNFDKEEIINELFVQSYEFICSYNTPKNNFNFIFSKLKGFCTEKILSFISKEYCIDIQNLKLYYNIRKYFNHIEMVNKQELHEILKYDFRLQTHEIQTYFDIENSLNNKFMPIHYHKNDADLLCCFEDVYDQTSLKQSIDRVLSTLKEKEKNVLIKLFGLDGDEPKSAAEVSKMFNLSSNRIIQIREYALRKLRHPSRIIYLIGYLW